MKTLTIIAAIVVVLWLVTQLVFWLWARVPREGDE